MRPCEISYVYFDNSDQERILREIVEPLRFLLPEWLRDLTFSKVDTEEKYALKCNVRREYRMAEICVRSAFFGQPKPTLRLNVIHELIHLHHAYVNDFVRVRVQDYVGSQNADLNKAMQSEYTDHLEGFIQDFAYVIRDLLLRAESVESISPTQSIREIAEWLMAAQGATGDAKAYTGVSAIAPKKEAL